MADGHGPRLGVHAFSAMLALLLAGCSPSSDDFSAPHQEALKDSVLAAAEGLREALGSGDPASAIGFYSEADGFTLMENGRIQYASAEEIRTALAEVADIGPMRTEFEETQVEALAPGVALMHTLFDTEIGDPADPGISFSGAMTLIWMHERDGWRILGGHSSQFEPAWAADVPTVVPMPDEPRHRVVYESPDLQIVDVRIPPGDTTLFHEHSRPIAGVEILPATLAIQRVGEDWGEPVGSDEPFESPGPIWLTESYRETPVSHRVAAVGSVEFRVILVVNPGPGSDDAPGTPLGPAGAPEVEGQWFRGGHLTLAPGEAVPWPARDRPVVAVLVTEGAVAVNHSGSVVDILSQVGDFAVWDGGEDLVLRNSTREPVTLALVEVR